jgi:hypothetical protein
MGGGVGAGPADAGMARERRAALSKAFIVATTVEDHSG